MIELLNIDCMEYMKTLPDKAFDLAIVDPPYGIGINVSIGRRKGDAKSNYKKFAGEDKNIPSEDYFLRLDRVSKNQIIWGGNYMTEFLYPSPCWILWDKDFRKMLRLLNTKWRGHHSRAARRSMILMPQPTKTGFTRHKSP